MTGHAEDDLRTLARLGRRMRQLQAHYFALKRANSPDALDTLAASKKAEKEFDAAVAAVLDYRTPDLFGPAERGEA